MSRNVQHLVSLVKQTSSISSRAPTRGSQEDDPGSPISKPQNAGEPSSKNNVSSSAKNNRVAHGALLNNKGSNAFKGLSVLIIEDEIIDQKLAAINAARLGMQSTLVASATEAIELIKQRDENPFQLILIDYKIPSMDGLAASNLIKTQLGLSLPPKIILLSSYNKNEIFSGLVERHCVDEFMTKPITTDKLRVALENIQQVSENQNSPWPPRSSKLDRDAETADDILSRTHVLLAEDNEINQRVATGILKQKSIQVTTVNNGQEAIDKVFNASPDTFDIILMDMDMPVLDGIEATKKILANPEYKHIPIIALTAHISSDEKQRCLQVGMVEFLTKPVKPELLYETLLDHLD